MGDIDPIAIMYGGLEKLGPGDDENTLALLRSLPRSQFGQVLDVGCGSGRQTLALAGALDTVIHAIDNFAPFLEELQQKARARGLAQKVQTHCMDMADISREFRDVDLIWAEGSAYNLGFARALQGWAPALASGGYLVASELSWLEETAPERVRSFWTAAYPGMGSVEENCRVAERSGYRVLGTHTLPRQSWREGYYDILGPRSRDLLNHEDAAVRTLAAENQREIEIFDMDEGSFGYVFYILQWT